MLYLSKNHIEEIVSHCKAESPNEACGILAGKITGKKGEVRRVDKVYRMTNTDLSARTYFMDPKEQLKTFKEIRGLGLTMAGIYHSHPHSKAYPSAHDVELALYPEASYVIISLRDTDKPEIKSFRIMEGKIMEEAISFKL